MRAKLTFDFSPRAGAKPVIAPFVLFTVHQPYSLGPLNSPEVSKCAHNSQPLLLFKTWDVLPQFPRSLLHDERRGDGLKVKEGREGQEERKQTGT